jgi:hypothetical protein
VQPTGLKTLEMDATHNHPKNNRKKAIGKSNTTDCGQILSALDIERASFKLKSYGIDKLNFSFGMDNKGFEWNRKTPKTWTEQITQIPAKKPTTKLFKNTPHYQATIENFRDIDTFLRVQINPSKIIHPYHLITDRMVIADQLIGLQKDLEKDGIKVQLESAKLNRIDIANNMKLDEPIENYFSVMDAFQGKRQVRKQHNETRYWDNTQNQFIIYPKNKELSEIISQWQMPNVELTRAEMKLKNSDVISKKFGHNLMGDLISDDEVYSNIFNDYVRDVIFKEKQYKTQQIDFGEYYSLYEELYQEYGNRAFDIFLKSFGVLELVKQEKGIENIEKIIRKLHTPRTARRRLAEINDLVRIYNESVVTITPEFIRRNNELRYKILIPQTKAA